MSTMTYRWESELHRRWRAEGRQEGQKEGQLQRASAVVLRVLKTRGLAVPEDVARRVNERAEDLFAD